LPQLAAFVIFVAVAWNPQGEVNIMTAKVFPIIPASAKVLSFVTDRTKVVYIPTNKDYALMLSAKRPEEMLNWMGELWRD